MNCLPKSPRRTNQVRYQTRILDSREDSDHEYFNDYAADLDVSATAKAKETEYILSNAVDLAERNTGSILCFQNVSSKSSALQLGRRVSSIRSVEEMAFAHNLEERASLSSVGGSLDGGRSLPTFIRVEKGSGQPISAQKSWESMWSSDDDGADHPPGAHRSAPVGNKAPVTRSWSKLRNLLDREVDEATNEAAAPHRSATRSFDVVENIKTVRRQSRKLKRVQNPNISDTENMRSPAQAKDLPVEVALQENKKRWGRPRMGMHTSPEDTSVEKEMAPSEEEIFTTLDSEHEVDTTQEVSPDVSRVDEFETGDEAVGLDYENVEIEFQRTKKGWGWWRNNTELVLAPYERESEKMPELESKVECSQAEGMAEHSMSPHVIQTDEDACNNGTITLKSSSVDVTPTPYQKHGEVFQEIPLIEALGEWTGLTPPMEGEKNKYVPAVKHPNSVPVQGLSDVPTTNPTMNLSAEEAQSMECVWLSGIF